MLIKSVTAQDTVAIKLITVDTNFVAGSQIKIAFKTSKKGNYKLYCSNSYGATILNSTSEDNDIIFNIPEFISSKKGAIHWKLITSKTLLTGQVYVIAKDVPKPATLKVLLAAISVIVWPLKPANFPAGICLALSSKIMSQ